LTVNQGLKFEIYIYIKFEKINERNYSVESARDQGDMRVLKPCD